MSELQEFEPPWLRLEKLGTDQPEAARVLRSIELSLPYPPSGNHSVRHGRGGAHWLSPQTIAYRAAVAREVSAYGLGHGSALAGLPGPLATAWLVMPPDDRARDSDNVLKVVRDALTKAGLWADDSNRVIRRESLAWGPKVKGGRIELVVEVLG